MKYSSKKSGSALLIAILVMGVLMVLTLGLSDLVIREIRQTGDTVTAGKAYFAAEAGIENALLDLHEHLPGYEVPQPFDPNQYKEVQVEDQGDIFHFRYQILNTADKIPYFDPDRPIFLNPQGNVADGSSQSDHAVSPTVLYQDYAPATYNVLPLNQSAVIPLSSDYDGDGQPNDVQDFIIEYYFQPDESRLPAYLTISDNFNDLDILRWKIFGYPIVGGSFDSTQTDAISDFYPSAAGSTAQNPTCIGTDPGLLNTPYQQSCKLPIPSDKVDKNGDLTYWGAARECYTSDAGMDSETLDPVQTNCTIKSFISAHTQNYLVLTNVVNPEVIGISDPTNPYIPLDSASIYYRVIAKSDAGAPKLVREAASIRSDGFAGSAMQSIDVNIGLKSFLPVFHFSLYRTDASQAVQPAMLNPFGFSPGFTPLGGGQPGVQPGLMMPFQP